MIKKIALGQLKIGMYINDLDKLWLKHPFEWQCFEVDNVDTLNIILKSGIAEIYIDTDLGADTVSANASKADTENVISESSTFVPDLLIKRSPTEEFERAKNLYANANALMQNMMQDVRMGKQIQVDKCLPVVDNIFDSMFSAPSALLPLAQMKTRDEYTFQHSVSVAALSIAFGRVLNLPHTEIKELALGGLLHDVGKAKVPGKILNKPGKLNDAEYLVMKTHAANTSALLTNTKNVSEIAFNAASQHHERYDGTGYPLGLKGDEISLHGQMLAIVDVYDAITSIRVYHKGMPPTEALRKMFEWSGSHFNPRLVQAFIKGIGVYPAGSLVRMESGKLGIVRELVPDKLLQPIVQLIYDCKKMCHIDPYTVNLSAVDDKIKSHESFEKWGINQALWHTAESR